MRKIPENMWERIPTETLEKEKISRPSLTYWQDAWRRLKKNKLAMLGLICVILLIVWGFGGVWVTEFREESQYEEEYNKLVSEGKQEEADSLFILRPERKINNGNANLPAKLELYKIDDETFFYVIPYEFKVILVENGEIADNPLDEMIYRRDKKDIEATLALNQLGEKNEKEHIGKFLNMPKPMQQFKFFKVKDHIIYVPYYFTKEERFRLEQENKKIKDPVEREKDKAEIDKKLKKHKLYEVYLDGNQVEITDSMRNNKYWFETDQLGRDIYYRIMYGARISLTVAFVATLVNFVIGVFYGGISGYIGGKVDNLLMRIVDIISTVPLLIYVILIQVFFDQTGLFTICLALGIVFWVRMARLVRGQILSIKEQEYILAARTIGAGTWRILSRHLIPNAMGPIIVSLAMSIPQAIFTEAFLSFIGIGIAVPVASWGTMANEATQNLNAYPYQLFYPALFISITVLAFNFLGDGLRDALDPRLRK